MVHSVKELRPDMTAEQSAELIGSWLKTAEAAVSQGARMVFVTVRRQACPSRKTCTLCEHSGISGHIVAAQSATDELGPHWKVTALFDSKSVVRWCHENIAKLMAVHN